MLEFAKSFPDPDVLLALEPEELAGQLIVLVKNREKGGQFNPGNYVNELLNPYAPIPPYSRERVDQVAMAVSEAFAWLEGQALIVPNKRGALKAGVF